MDKIHSNERKDLHLPAFHFVDTSLFVRAYPVSARTAAQWLTFLLAELWPSPTKVAGLFFSLFPQVLCWGILILPVSSQAKGSILIQNHIVILKQLLPIPHVILGCRLGLVCIQVKPEALLQTCTSCAPVPNGSIRVWNSNWYFGFGPAEYWEHSSQRTRTNLVKSKKCEGEKHREIGAMVLPAICSYWADLLADTEVPSEHSKKLECGQESTAETTDISVLESFLQLQQQGEMMLLLRCISASTSP